MESISWKVIDKYFNDNVGCLVSHHLESYNEFFQSGLHKIFKENNPIRFLEPDSNETKGNKETKAQGNTRKRTQKTAKT